MTGFAGKPGHRRRADVVELERPGHRGLDGPVRRPARTRPARTRRTPRPRSGRGEARVPGTHGLVPGGVVEVVAGDLLVARTGHALATSATRPGRGCDGLGRDVGGDHPDPPVVQEPPLQPRRCRRSRPERDADLVVQRDSRIIASAKCAATASACESREAAAAGRPPPTARGRLRARTGPATEPRCSARSRARERRSTADRMRIAGRAARPVVITILAARAGPSPPRGRRAGPARPSTCPRDGRRRSRTSRRRGRPCRWWSSAARQVVERQHAGRAVVQLRPVGGRRSGRSRRPCRRRRRGTPRRCRRRSDGRRTRSSRLRPRRVGDAGQRVLVPADGTDLGVPAAVGGDQDAMTGHGAP